MLLGCKVRNEKTQFKMLSWSLMGLSPDQCCVVDTLNLDPDQCCVVDPDPGLYFQLLPPFYPIFACVDPNPDPYSE